MIMKKQSISLVFILVCLSFFSLRAQAQSADALVKVACVGNSITERAGLGKTYPVVLQELLGEKFEVRNYGLGGRTLLKKGNLPYWNEDKYKEVLDWNPDVVVIMLGTNDTKPQNWQYKAEFVDDYVEFINSFKSLQSEPKVFICYPIPVFESKFDISPVAMKEEVLPAIKKIARKAKVETIDVNTPFLGKGNLTYDGIHPNDEGAKLLATEVFNQLKKRNAVSVK